MLRILTKDLSDVLEAIIYALLNSVAVNYMGRFYNFINYLIFMKFNVTLSNNSLNNCNAKKFMEKDIKRKKIIKFIRVGTGER